MCVFIYSLLCLSDGFSVLSAELLLMLILVPLMSTFELLIHLDHKKIHVVIIFNFLADRYVLLTVAFGSWAFNSLRWASRPKIIHYGSYGE